MSGEIESVPAKDRGHSERSITQMEDFGIYANLPGGGNMFSLIVDK
jgi:hypothetical protein